MKTRILFMSVLLVCTAHLFPQAPQAFKYQTVIRNPLGAPIADQTVGIRLGIIAGNPSGTIVYNESHIATTNQFGIVTLQVGKGTVIDGTFNSINWGSNEHYLKVEADITGGTSYLHMGTTQLLSVPYALFSQYSGDAIHGSGNPFCIAFWDSTTFLTGDSNLSWNKEHHRLGIGTANPIACLHVKDSAVVFTGPPDLSPNPTKPPSGGAGTRMMWYPEMAAFRTGGVTGTEWDRENTGYYSFATGKNTTASGNYATAHGAFSCASGLYTTALGDSSIASGDWSFASGRNAEAIGSVSVAFGNSTSASGNRSVAMGSYTTSSGDYSMACGYNTTSQSRASTVMGSYNVISGSTYAWIPTDPLFIVGNGTNSSSRSNALTLLKNGRTGIGTPNPLARLHVSDSAVVFTGPSAPPSSPASPPVSGSGIRMMWYPDKASLRVGRVDADHWDKDNIGKYSFACGYSTKATGDCSSAFGKFNTASGTSSICYGYHNIASGDYSAVFGLENDATGSSSLACGENTEASGERSAVFGIYNEASGNMSVAFGSNNKALGSCSSAFGFRNQASGIFSAVFGDNNGAMSESSIALGHYTLASGNYSAVFGISTTAQSYGSSVFGRFNIISGNSTDWIETEPLFIVGNGANSSSRNNALTILKNGYVGIQESNPNCRLVVKSSTLGDIAEDWLNWVVLNGSTTAGNTENLKVIHRRHAAGTDWHTSEIRLQRVVDQTFMNYIAFKGSNSGSVIEFGSGPYNDPRMTFNDAGTLFINATGSSAHKLYVNGSAYSTVSWQSSDEKFKKNIQSIENPLSILSKINGKTYHWKTDEYQQFGKDGQKQYGFIAQEVEEILPELVNTDLNGEKALCYDQFVPILVEAVKELKKQNEALRKRIELLEMK